MLVLVIPETLLLLWTARKRIPQCFTDNFQPGAQLTERKAIVQFRHVLGAVEARRDCCRGGWYAADLLAS